MIYQKKTINNVPTKVPLSNSAPVGNPIGTIISTYKKIQPRNYLYCDGSTFDETVYPALYLYLGTNVLPDYRECAIVGAEKNTTDVFDSTETDPSTGLPGTQDHDVYAQGEFKDDQLQDHEHELLVGNARKVLTTGGSDRGYSFSTLGSNSARADNIIQGRHGSVTRGKRKAVYYYIKAVDGVDISDEDTFLNTVKNYVVNTVKNYVDGKNSYSTDEILTGSTWIDGKPIYRKTFEYNDLLCNQDRVRLQENFPIAYSNIVNMKLVAYNSRTAGMMMIINTIYFFNGGVYFVDNVSQGYFNIKLTVEYTKTTD